MSDIIELNVGGTYFTTTAATLQMDPDSMLARLMGAEALGVTRDAGGRLFIDRDALLFRHVLNFLRDGVLRLPKDFAEVPQLLAEARFFHLAGMIKGIQAAFPVESVAPDVASVDLITTALRNTLTNSLREAQRKVDYLFSSSWGRLAEELLRQAGLGLRTFELELVGRSEPEGRLDGGRLYTKSEVTPSFLHEVKAFLSSKGLAVEISEQKSSLLLSW
eukprot:TRINITY_DN5758_c0_g1_i1.p1 TRINITY_DN5758_c0_g1~~TRINITY_DN5758_c0_g1_i1.p1  ORF type:complete len:219 (+),score=62.04 TRINITY_DN5758_c0_g1_i1:75-731(+)